MIPTLFRMSLLSEPSWPLLLDCGVDADAFGVLGVVLPVFSLSLSEISCTTCVTSLPIDILVGVVFWNCKKNYQWIAFTNCSLFHLFPDTHSPTKIHQIQYNVNAWISHLSMKWTVVIMDFDEIKFHPVLIENENKCVPNWFFNVHYLLWQCKYF